MQNQLAQMVCFQSSSVDVFVTIRLRKLTHCHTHSLRETSVHFEIISNIHVAKSHKINIYLNQK